MAYWYKFPKRVCLEESPACLHSSRSAPQPIPRTLRFFFVTKPVSYLARGNWRAPYQVYLRLCGSLKLVQQKGISTLGLALVMCSPLLKKLAQFLASGICKPIALLLFMPEDYTQIESCDRPLSKSLPSPTSPSLVGRCRRFVLPLLHLGHECEICDSCPKSLSTASRADGHSLPRHLMAASGPPKSGFVPLSASATDRPIALRWLAISGF